jgi:hypothetical protein
MAEHEPTSPRIYHVPQAETDSRQQVQQAARSERADLLLELVSLIPGKQHAEALRIVLELEAVDVNTSRDLRDSWLQTVQRAYVAGRVDAVNESIEAITGEPQGSPPCGTRVH